jgi:hypothetical protein
MSLQRLLAGAKLLAVAALSGCVVATAPANPAADGHVRLGIALVSPDTPGKRADEGRWLIYLDGYFDAQSASRLSDVLADRRITSAAVYLNSPGGSLLEGMAIGRLLREHGFDTSVGKRGANPLQPVAGVCYSACPFAYAGGAQRTLVAGSVLGVHRAGNRVPVPDEAAFERRVGQDATRYLNEVGVSPQLFELMMQVPPGEIRLLDRGEAVALRLVNAGTIDQPADRTDGAER